MREFSCVEELSMIKMKVSLLLLVCLALCAASRASKDVSKLQIGVKVSMNENFDLLPVFDTPKW